MSHAHTKLITVTNTRILRADDFQRVTDNIQAESFVSRLASMNVALNIRFGS
jgi:hypothetical protein